MASSPFKAAHKTIKDIDELYDKIDWTGHPELRTNEISTAAYKLALAIAFMKEAMERRKKEID